MFTEAEIDDYQFPLPGFRFHPTDEELVGFYLRRKVDKKAIGTELIKSIDIYKHNPWDLPNAGNNLGEKEWYFFCKRARKYKNSVRPNRVTSSGFWKATGIDKPIYNVNNKKCIGLKKSLVYYNGNAGKGTKTEWMMHEFRLPTNNNSFHHNSIFATITNHNLPQQAEIWTLCRIFKRSVSCTKYSPNWREIASANDRSLFGDMNNNNNNNLGDQSSDKDSTYINFSKSFINFDEKKPLVTHEWNPMMMNFSSISEQLAPSSTINSPSSSLSNFDGDATDLFGYKDRKKLQLLHDFSYTNIDPSSVLYM